MVEETIEAPRSIIENVNWEIKILFYTNKKSQLMTSNSNFSNLKKEIFSKVKYEQKILIFKKMIADKIKMWSNIVVRSVITQVRSEKLRCIWRLSLNWDSFKLHLVSQILISSFKVIAGSHNGRLLNNWLNILHVFLCFDIDNCGLSVNHFF